VINLNRRLDFRSIALIETGESLAFYATALLAAALGLGAYSLAGAIGVGAIAAAVIAHRLAPWHHGYSLNLTPIRSVARFGVQVGAIQIGTVARELGLVAVLTGVGGPALAGFYGMSRRLFSLPLAAMTAIQRVGMTAFGRMREGPERTSQAAKAVAVSMLAVGLPMALIAGSAEPLVSAVFGGRWAPSAHMTEIASVGVLLFAGTGTIVSSKQLADGNAGTPLIAAALQIALLGALAAILVPGRGTTGAGIAVAVGYAAFTIAVLAASGRDAELYLVPAIRGLGVAILAALAGLAASTGPVGVALALSLAASGLAWLAAAYVISRADLLLLTSLLRRHLFRN
jgi:PST family polysaccharide transporter